jgi:MFS family permease
VLVVLTVALMISTIDRGILSLLVAPIKRDLGVSDTQMSLLLAAVMATVHEPERRGLMARGSASSGKSLPIRQIVLFLSDERKTYVPIFLAMGIKALLSFGAAQWTPTFFVRTYGWTVPQSGFLQGLILLFISPLGLMAGGWLAERYAKRGYEDANMRVVLIATIAALQVITPNQMRGQISALYMFIFNIVGYGIGPVAVALFTDYVFQAESDLRYSIAAVASITAPIAVLVVWYGLKPYGESVMRANARA